MEATNEAYTSFLNEAALKVLIPFSATYPYEVEFSSMVVIKAKTAN